MTGSSPRPLAAALAALALAGCAAEPPPVEKVAAAGALRARGARQRHPLGDPRRRRPGRHRVPPLLPRRRHSGGASLQARRPGAPRPDPGHPRSHRLRAPGGGGPGGPGPGGGLGPPLGGRLRAHPALCTRTATRRRASSTPPAPTRSRRGRRSRPGRSSSSRPASSSATPAWRRRWTARWRGSRWRSTRTSRPARRWCSSPPEPGPRCG